MSKQHLVVVHPFGDYGRGDRIEGKAMDAVLETHRHHVVTSQDTHADEAGGEPEPAAPAPKAGPAAQPAS